MTTQCYEQVRGSAIRVTGLTKCGEIAETIPYVVSTSVRNVRINEVTEAGSNETQRNDDDERRIRVVRPAVSIRYTVDIDFLRVDPGLLSLVAGVPLTYQHEWGFGEGPFGEMPFGGPSLSDRVVNGFDVTSRLTPTSFALEIWSKLAGRACADGPRWGYTLFPFLKGGRVSGVKWANQLVSFNLRGAATQRGSGWGIGPYDIEGPGQRLLQPVSGNTNWRNSIVSMAPPVQTNGIQQHDDSIDGGTAMVTTDDVVDGEFVVTSPWVVEGGAA